MRCHGNAIALLLLAAGVPSLHAQALTPEGVLRVWFHHVERNELDSLRPLLIDDFRFVSDGKRMGPAAFVSMIKSLGIRDPRVTLSNIETHEAGDVAYLVYDRNESVRAGGSTRTFPETGSVVLVRTRGNWRIAEWTATSPPP